MARVSPSPTWWWASCYLSIILWTMPRPVECLDNSVLSVSLSDVQGWSYFNVQMRNRQDSNFNSLCLSVCLLVIYLAVVIATWMAMSWLTDSLKFEWTTVLVFKLTNYILFVLCISYTNLLRLLTHWFQATTVWSEQGYLYHRCTWSPWLWRQHSTRKRLAWEVLWTRRRRRQ